MKRNELVEELDRTLNVAAFPGDASNNGLQIEGAPEVKRILFGVDGCLALFEHAAAGHFDFVFVHHGISWGGEPRRFTGIHAERFRVMFGNNISLYGVHLPLDAHPELGNNARLAELAELTRLEPFCNYHGYDIGFLGHTKKLVKAAELEKELGTKLKAKPRLIGRVAHRGGDHGPVDGQNQGLFHIHSPFRQSRAERSALVSVYAPVQRQVCCPGGDLF